MKGARFLDLFAGSGAVGIEAWSRGAGWVCWVESDRAVLKTLRRNVGCLCPQAGEIVGADVRRFLSYGQRYAPFDIVFLDPPYGGARKTVLSAPSRRRRRFSEDSFPVDGLLRDVAFRRLLAPGGTVVLEERATSEASPAPEGWRVWMERVYGETRMRFLGP